MSALEKIQLAIPAEMEQDAKFESAWAERLSDGVFRLRNIPFLAEVFAPDDVVVATDRNGQWVVDRVITRSSYSVLLCVCSDIAAAELLVERLNELGARYEYGFSKKMLAIAVTGTAALRQLRKTLRELEKQDALEYG